MYSNSPKKNRGVFDKIWLLKKIDSYFLLDQKGKFTELEGVRGWAVFIVFMFHFALSTQSYFGNQAAWGINLKITDAIIKYIPIFGSVGGNFGVELFFILSGFFIYKTIRRNNPTLKRFLINRFKRLIPAHLIILLQSLTVLTPIAMVVNIFFLTYFFPQIAAVNFVTWAISYELLFYFICALLFIAGRNNKTFSSWIFFLLLVAFLFITENPATIAFSKIGIKYIEMNRFVAFFFGLGLSKLYLDNKNVWNKAKRIFISMVIPALCGIIAIKLAWDNQFYMNFGITSQRTAQYLLFDLSAFFLIGFLLSSSKTVVHGFFNLRLFRVLGAVSYSFYLNHAIWGIPIGARIADALIPGGGTIKIVLYLFSCLTTTFCISLFMYTFLEKPYFIKR